MKTVLLAPELFASQGGIPRILRLYLKALCELAEPDGEVRMVVLNDQTIDSTDLRAFATDRLTDWYACGQSRIQFVRATLRAIRGCEHLVCGHIGQLPVAWLARLRYPQIRYTLIAHGLEVWRPFSLLERQALRRAHRIWCVSDITRRELLKRIDLPPDRATVLPNGLDPAFKASPPAQTEAGSATILTVSRLSLADRYKGIDHLIEAMPLIRERVPNAVLRVVGRGDDLARLQTLAAAKGVSAFVHFVGYLADAELNREFGRCQIFALPSEREGFGLVYLEAMAHGKPCVGADAGGTPEVISPETGLLSPYGNIPALASTCTEALMRNWEPGAIQARADLFSYSRFRDRLRSLLDG